MNEIEPGLIARDLKCKKDCQLGLKCTLRKMCLERIRLDLQHNVYTTVEKGSEDVEILRDGCTLGFVTEGTFAPLL